MIIPTIGRVVWFRPVGTNLAHQPCSAQIAFVHGERCINVGGFDAQGQPFACTSVRLLQDDDVPTVDSEGFLTESVAEWMPFQTSAAQALAAAQVTLESLDAKSSEPVESTNEA